MGPCAPPYACLAGLLLAVPPALGVAGSLLEKESMNLVPPPLRRLFAAEYRRSGRALHILVHNAGALTFSTRHNEHGIAELCQVHAAHLGMACAAGRAAQAWAARGYQLLNKLAGASFNSRCALPFLLTCRQITWAPTC